MENVLLELAAEPWSTLVVAAEGELSESKSYFVKSKFTAATYVFLVTDLQSVWVQSCDRNDIKTLKQEFNPLVDSPVARILQLVKHSLLDAAMHSRDKSGSPSVKHQVELKEDGQLALHFSTKIDFYCFKWTFNCNPLTGEEQRISFLRTSFLQPLLVITTELQQELRELKSVIALKDAEIAEYKSKGIKLPKPMQTARFDAEEFESKRLASGSFRKSLREPTFSIDGVTAKILKMLTTSREVDEEEKRTLSRQVSCASLPLSAATSTQPSCDGGQSPGESKRKRAKLASMTPTLDATAPSMPLFGVADEQVHTPTRDRSVSRAPDTEVNALSYLESPDEAVRKTAIRERLEALAKKKEEKKQVKAAKRKFQFI